jgi:uncharacterized protein YdaT
MGIGKLLDKSVPKHFHGNNRTKKERVISLATEAKEWLLANNSQVDVASFLEATRKVDEDGQGISHSTLFKNKAVNEIFNSIKPKRAIKKKRIKKVKVSKSNRSQKINLRDKYREYSRTDILIMIEDFQKQLTELKAKITELTTSRDELNQRVQNQLILLTRLKEEGKF